MPHPARRFLIYLLDMWQEQPAAPGQPAVWRFSLEDAQANWRRGFGSPEAVAAFLHEQMESPSIERRTTTQDT